jgi:uncharacterized membrane protein
MTWRGATTSSDRAFACLFYLLPLLDGIGFAGPLIREFPPLRFLLLPLAPLLEIYSFPFVGLIVFFAVFILVVRNESIRHFVRFNAMQAILLSIIVFLCQIIIQYILSPAFGPGLLLDTLFNVIFLGLLAAVIYSVAQSIMGRYAEIPTLSEAVYMQVR